MALIKAKPGAEARGKRNVLANQTDETIKEFLSFDGKSLVDIDLKYDGKLIDIAVGKKALEDGTEITNLVLEFKDKRVAFPMSRGFSEELDENPDGLLDGEFYVRNKFGEGDVEGEYPYTGAKYISFGKPSGITFDTLESAVKTEVVVGP
jgi:hypothetical protein